MLNKKYIFETRGTRLRRKLKLLLLLLLLPLFLYFFNAIHIMVLSEEFNEQSRLKFFQKAPDLIVVFTGGRGRIEYALQLRSKYPNAKVFISGVHAKNNTQILMNQFLPKNIKEESNIDDLSKFIEIDYLANNTLENVLSTLHYMRDNPNLNNILIVSSDYHLKRINHIISRVADSTTQKKFYLFGVENSLTKLENIRILHEEVLRYFRTYIFLWLWGNEG